MLQQDYSFYIVWITLLSSLTVAMMVITVFLLIVGSTIIKEKLTGSGDDASMPILCAVISL